MELIIGIVVGILAGVIGFWLFNRKQKVELESLKKAKTDLTNERDETQKKKVDLENQLKKAKTEIGNLEKESAEKTAQIGNLESDLTAANIQINSLTNQLKDVSKSNENALWLLHLAELSLQTSVFLLYKEQSYANSLAENHRKLNKKYQGLGSKYQALKKRTNKTIKEYSDFQKKVQRKAKRRLAIGGGGAILSFLPGIGLVQLLADIADMVNDVNDASEDIADLYDALDMASIKLTNEMAEDLKKNVNISSLLERPSLDISLDDIEDSEISNALIQEVQRSVTEEFEKTLEPDGETPNPSELNDFVKSKIERTKDLIESAKEGKSEKTIAIAKTADRFRALGVKLYDYHKQQDQQTEKNAANSNKEG